MRGPSSLIAIAGVLLGACGIVPSPRATAAPGTELHAVVRNERDTELVVALDSGDTLRAPGCTQVHWHAPLDGRWTLTVDGGEVLNWSMRDEAFGTGAGRRDVTLRVVAGADELDIYELEPGPPARDVEWNQTEICG